jgi:hypothetical protein
MAGRGSAVLVKGEERSFAAPRITALRTRRCRIKKKPAHSVRMRRLEGNAMVETEVAADAMAVPVRRLGAAKIA